MLKYIPSLYKGHPIEILTAVQDADKHIKPFFYSFLAVLQGQIITVQIISTESNRPPWADVQGQQGAGIP